VLNELGSGIPRSTGLHQSDIIKDISATMFGEKGHWDYAAEPGFLWEDVFSRAWADREHKEGVIFRPEEVEKDGISISPDGLFVPNTATDAGLLLVEYKYTWQSSLKPPQDRWEWMTQLMGYCWVLELSRVRLHVFHCNGDYRENRRPQYLEWEIGFEEWEMRENWDMLVNHAKGKGWL